ncbi:MAG: hypothetical protein ABSC31_13675 [Acidimicrobiales bacterium]|jgi:hypothetical protein
MEDEHTFSPAFLDAERQLLAYTATLRSTADEIEATVTGLRAFVAEHAEVGS